MVKRWIGLVLVMMFVVSCQSKVILTEVIAPSPTNAAFPSSTTTAIPTELILAYGGTLLPQTGQIYKLETDTSSYQRLWIVDLNQNIVLQTYNGRGMDLSPNLQFGAYISNGDIWLLNVKSGKQINLTNTPDCDEDSTFTWSPDSQELAYFGCPNNSQLDDLYIVEVFDGKSKNLTNTPDKSENLFIQWWKTQPNLIFFGFRIPKESIPGSALRGQCHTQGGECLYFLASIQPDGLGYKEIDNVSGVGFPPSLSPDGKTIAYDGGLLYNLETQIYQVNNPSQFGISPSTPVNDDGLELVRPEWSPSGNQIIWLGHVLNEPYGQTAIYFFDLVSHSGKVLHRYDPYYYSLTLPPWQRWSDLEVRWSPDEKYIAIISDEFLQDRGTPILRVFDNKGNLLQKYEGAFSNIAWSPNSKLLTFGYFEQTSKSLTTLVLDVEDWQLHPLDIPADSEIIKWVELK